MRFWMQMMSLLQKRSGIKRFKRLNGKRGLGSWMLILLSGAGAAAMMVLQLNRNKNKNGKKEMRHEVDSFRGGVSRPQRKPVRKMDYGWAMEIAEEFLKNTSTGKKA